MHKLLGNILFKYLKIILIMFLIGCDLGSSKVKYPHTKQEELLETIFGRVISDPYRWLEDFTSNEVKAWVEEQNKITDQFLKNPIQRKIKRDLEEIWETSDISIPFKKEDKTFYFYDDGKKQQSVLMMKDCDSCEARILLDPNNFSEDGTISLGDVSVSPNGKYLAFSISDGGSDWRTWKVLDIDHDQILEDLIEYSKFSYAVWEQDSSGFYYQKYNPTSVALSDLNKSPKLYFHKLGTKQNQDRLIYQDTLNPDLSWSINIPQEGAYRILSIGEGTDERNFLSISFDDSLNFIPLISEFVATYNFLGGTKDRAWFFSNLDAPNGRIFLLDLSSYEPIWRDLIPESKFPISSASVVGDKLILNYLVDTLSEVKIFDLEGNFITELPFEGKGTLSGFKGSLDNKISYFEFSNFITPQTIYELNLETLSFETYWKTEIKGLDVAECKTSLEFYSSKDGTQIPIHLSHSTETKLTKETPVLLYGYGGFNISILPYFSKTFYMWIKSGGVLAVANIRGGSEYGDRWHKEGMLLNKQNVFDDFAYAAKYLHTKEIGSPDTTTSLGRSNGGLLVAASLLQNPDLFKVAIPQVGVLDMLRFHKFTIGWAWESDYGEPNKEQDFLNLLSYSPYHNISSSICYPTTLITTSSRDDRVVPAHSYKFAARLQEAQQCSNPILLRVESRAGHGAGTSKEKQIDEIADIFGYALNIIRGN